MAIHIDNNLDQVVDDSRRYGTNTDVAVVGDFSGNTLSSIAAYRPSTGVWFLDRDSNGVADRIIPLGGPDWTPLSGDMDGNGVSELVAYNRTNGQWGIANVDGVLLKVFGFGGRPGDVPLAGDFDHDGRTEAVIYNNGTWSVDTNLDGQTDRTFRFGPFGQSDIPIITDTFGSRNPNLAIFNDGVWRIDFNRDGVVDTGYFLGTTGDRPITGFLSAANSLFVNPGGSDANTGGPFSPLATVNAAIRRAPAGTHIRLSAGTFRENVGANGSLFARNDLSFSGTGPSATVILPFAGDAFLLDRSTNILIDNLRLVGVGGGGRGLASLGSTVTTQLVSTVGSRGSGVVTTDYLGRVNRLDAYLTHFDSSQTGEGLWLSGGSTAFVHTSTFNDNGTDRASIPFFGGAPASGRGLRIEPGSNAVVDDSLIIGNYGGGIIGLTDSFLTMTNSVSSFNSKGAGAFFLGHSTAHLFNNLFEGNGEVRGVTTGLNGVEFYFDFTGSAAVAGNYFKRNTANGIFATGRNLFFKNNTFEDNVLGIGLQGTNANGTSPIPTEVVIQGNLFVVPPNSQELQEGIFALGSGIRATIGGRGAEANTFVNYSNVPGFYRAAIEQTDRGLAGNVLVGCPTFLNNVDTDNIFSNSSNRGRRC